jgi:hypothetical protein
LVTLGIDRYGSSLAGASSDHKDAWTSTLACPHARVKLLGVTEFEGAAVYAGLLVRASVTSSVACTMRGYSNVGVELDNRSTATAHDVRFGYLPGGMTTTNEPLPRLSITLRPRVVSFTMQWVSGNGHTCPWINAIEFTSPGSREILTARTMHQTGIGVTRLWGIYCGYLQVRPLVNGSSGS